VIVAWDPSLSVGIPELDQQHASLFARLDGLIQAVRSGASRDEVGRTLLFLREYVQTHFADEEGIMRQAGFPRLAEHHLEHEGFVADLRQLEIEHRRNGASPGLVLRVSARLTSWLREHVSRADRELGAFLEAARSGPR
jgi:hemerythrin